MSADDETTEPRAPRWRTGWSWTLIKCGAAVVAAVAAATGGFYALLRALLDRLPGWLPGTWAEWLFRWVLRHVWFVGPVVGALAGLAIAAGIVVWDAKRGRLSRLR